MIHRYSPSYGGNVSEVSAFDVNAQGQLTDKTQMYNYSNQS